MYADDDNLQNGRDFLINYILDESMITRAVFGLESSLEWVKLEAFQNKLRG